MEYEDISPNLWGAAKSEDHPIEKVFRLKDKNMNAKFQMLQENIEELGDSKSGITEALPWTLRLIPFAQIHIVGCNQLLDASRKV